MDHEDKACLKQREIFFRYPHPDTDQAATACQLFDDLDCITEVIRLSEHGIRICYDIRHTCLEDIESALIETGFHLDNNIMVKIRRALYYYTEETQRENMGINQEQNCVTREVFIQRYDILKHGCRDERPGHWRRYL